MALFELLQLCVDLGDDACVEASAKRLSGLTGESGEAAYIASLVTEVFDEPQRNAFLLRGAELGCAAAQLDAAANFAFGLNGFELNANLAEKWLRLAEKSAPAEAQHLRERIARHKNGV